MRAIGIDIYQLYQPNYVLQAHHDFIVMKIADGSRKVGFERIFKQAEFVPAKIGYIYLRSNSTAHAQIDTVCAIDNDFDLDAYAVDFERYGNKPSRAFGQILKDVIDGVADRTGKKVLLYSNPAVVQEWLLFYGHTWAKDYPLWIAQYPYRGWNEKMRDVPRSEDWQPRLPAGFTNWKFWQYSADGNKQGPDNGIMKPHPWSVTPSVDMDVFNGTAEELMQWIGGKAEKVEENERTTIITHGFTPSGTPVKITVDIEEKI